ncbi:hypothetical protein CERZMDRAFT_102774 [Cercospora zeae-maydis SCOH1-5]|uniref:BTB domain-containing protein n=1 Tax=Cercospora zeae-maydis SCOH1-5 TaxID=717836 RepID=A0A6A6F034_9PEZI|nr:hypothetical protein CERZMDRAFT_102774 [Cercospora zeae-maydis SCOH1-5]
MDSDREAGEWVYVHVLVLAFTYARERLASPLLELKVRNCVLANIPRQPTQHRLASGARLLQHPTRDRRLRFACAQLRTDQTTRHLSAIPTLSARWLNTLATCSRPESKNLTIECRGTFFQVHKLVLHTQSRYFKKLFAGGFKEGVAATNVAHLPLDEDLEIFSVLIRHLYSFTYDDSTRGEAESAPFAVFVYALADKYHIEPLRAQAAKRLKETIDPRNVDTFIETVHAVDENTADQVLWDIVIPVIKSNVGQLLKHEQFRDMLHGMKDLLFRLLSMLDPSAGKIELGKVQEQTADVDGEEGDIDDERDDFAHYMRFPHGPGRRLG